MRAVLFHPQSGAIIQVVDASRANIEATAALLSVDWLDAPGVLDDVDVTHRVQDGALVAIGEAD